jgi:ATP-binding cassette subfamily C (CFTR/MRP) protein 1
MTLSAAARQSYSVGQVVNLAATDSAPFHESIMQIYMAWSMPVQLTLSIYFLFLELGMAMFAGVAVLVVLIPFNVVFGRLGRMFHHKQLKAKVNENLLYKN